MGELRLLVNQHFEMIECCICGVPFAMTHELYTARRKTHAGFFCPNGHSQHFTAKSDAEKLAEQTKALDSMRAQLLVEQNAKRVLEEKLARTKNGVCPCCNRTFQNLLRHMRTKHPEQAKRG